MEYIAYWDWFTYFLYMFIGLLVVFFIKQAETDSHIENQVKCYSQKGKLYYLSAFLILVLFAATRLVTKNIGGTDAWKYYIDHFLSPPELHISIWDVLTLNKAEPLFYLFVKVIRLFTDNYHIYFLFIYAIIAYGFLKYASKNYSKEGFFLPYFLFMLPYLHSFSGIRWYLCMAFALISMCHLQDRHVKKAFLFAVISFLFHYTGLLIIGFHVFVLLVKKYVEPKLKSDKAFLYFFGSCFLLVFISVPILRTAILITKYDAYLRKGFSLWGYIPMLLLIGLTAYFVRDIRGKDNGKLNLYGVIFNFIVTPIVMFCGAYRFDYFFMPAKFIVWGYIAKILFCKINEKYQNKYVRIAMYAIMVSGILVWFTFRIYQMHITNSLMPYINMFFV